MKSVSLISIVALSLTINACKRNSTDPTDGIPPVVAEYFPNTVGSQWTYSVFNKQDSTYDTLHVTIIGNTTFSNGKNVSLWKYSAKTGIDTFYYYVTSDTAEIYESAIFLNTRFLLPFSTGRAWKSNGTNKISDSVHITKDSIFVNLRSDKPRGFYLERNWGGLNEYGMVTYWFVPEIGIVKEERREWGFSFSNIRYDLISYSIK